MSLNLKDSNEHISKMAADASPPEVMLQARPGGLMVQIGFQSQTTIPSLHPPLFPAVLEEIAPQSSRGGAHGTDERASPNT